MITNFHLLQVLNTLDGKLPWHKNASSEQEFPDTHSRIQFFCNFFTFQNSRNFGLLKNKEKDSQMASVLKVNDVCDLMMSLVFGALPGKRHPGI